MADGIGPTPAPIGPAPGGPPAGGVPPGINPAAAAAAPGLRPTPRGAGNQAMAMMQISEALQQIQAALPNLPIGSEIHKATLKALSDLSKHYQGPSAATDGPQQTMAQDRLRQMMQQAMLRRVLQSQAGGAPGGGAPAQAMPAATPLPGA